MSDRIDYPLVVYFDGACMLCRQQVSHFANADTKKRLVFQDITAPDFHAENVGLDIGMLQNKIHVKERDGRVASGAEAIVWIWWAVGNKLPAILMRFPGIRFIFKFLYKIVARSRYIISGWGDKKLCRGKCGWRKY